MGSVTKLAKSGMPSGGLFDLLAGLVFSTNKEVYNGNRSVYPTLLHPLHVPKEHHQGFSGSSKWHSLPSLWRKHGTVKRRGLEETSRSQFSKTGAFARMNREEMIEKYTEAIGREEWHHKRKEHEQKEFWKRI